MPARSNDFQRLVRMIELQLAPTGASVTESAMIFDRHAGIEREVDILVEYDLGIRRLRTGIECRDRSRPADVTWIDQVIQTHRSLGLHRSVVVSRSGFTRTAMRKAELLGIDALTLEDATDTDWALRLANIQFSLSVYDQPVPETVMVKSALSDSDTVPRRFPADTTALEDVSGESLGTLSSLIVEYMTSQQLRDFLQAERNGRDELVFDLKIQPTVPTFIRVEGSERHLIQEVIVTAHQRIRSVTVQMVPVSYGGQEVAFGRGEIEGIPFEIHVARQRDDPEKFDMHLAYPDALKEIVDVSSIQTSLTKLR